jgi:hypothetical protein
LIAKGKVTPCKDDPELLSTRFEMTELKKDSEEFQRIHEVLKEGSKCVSSSLHHPSLHPHSKKC